MAAAAAAVVLVLGLAACGDDDDVITGSEDDGTTITAAAPPADDDPYGSGGTTTGGDEATSDTVEAVDFSLTSLTVGSGSEVTFENRGENPHTMTADDGSFDSGQVGPGESASVAAPEEPGDYAFHCEIHPAMTATLTVES
jgi:plastocyanin